MAFLQANGKIFFSLEIAQTQPKIQVKNACFCLSPL